MTCPSARSGSALTSMEQRHISILLHWLFLVHQFFSQAAGTLFFCLLHVSFSDLNSICKAHPVSVLACLLSLSLLEMLCLCDTVKLVRGESIKIGQRIKGTKGIPAWWLDFTTHWSQCTCPIILLYSIIFTLL